MPRKQHNNKEQQQAKADRIKACLDESGITMTAVARYCDISIQSISNWKKTGQVEDENLFKFSELTGFRYVWLKTGTGDKRFVDSDENRREYVELSPGTALRAEEFTSGSVSGERLLAALRRALVKDDVDHTALEHLADFLDCLSGFRPPDKEVLAGVDATPSQLSIEDCLICLSGHIAAIKPELRSSVGELLKVLCEKPDSPELFIQSILATAQVSESASNA